MIKIITDAALVTDVELKFGASGKAYAQFRAVSKERKRDAGGNWVDGEETFFSVVCFGKPAEMLAESDPAKGTRLIIEGKAKIDKWVSKQDGQERQSLSVVADHIGLELLFTAYDRRDAERTARGTAAKSGQVIDDEFPTMSEAPF